MIRSLHIENIAVIKSLDVEFCGGMTVLSGETGAGKSIIIDSLSLLLGAKADRDMLRSGESKATVSAVFDNVGDGVVRLLEDMGFEGCGEELMLTRTFSAGSSSAKLNGRTVTVSMLREIGGALFNIHGQNDNQQLLDASNHVKLLDSFASDGELLSEYSELYRQILSTRCEIDSIRTDTMERNRLREMLAFQIEDIDALKLKAGEERALEELVKRLSDAEKISRACALVEKALLGGEKVMGASYLTDRASSALESIAASIPEADKLAARLNDLRYELEDVAECAKDLCDIGEGDPTARLDKAQSRLSAIAKLKRKYGSTVEEILEYRESCAVRLDAIENADERLEELSYVLASLEGRAKEIALRLREVRKKYARELSTRVCETLAFLDMPKVRFEVRVAPSDDFGAFGCDKVEFLISTNVGEPLGALAKIASGGELARIMLSLKNVLNECDGVQTVIFDEIDTGISGKTSRKVGIKLKEISASSQVLCVTHSAQIASVAHNHLKIFKTEADGRVSTGVAYLDANARVEEISRILGGIEITDAQRQAARELISEGESY